MVDHILLLPITYFLHAVVLTKATKHGDDKNEYSGKQPDLLKSGHQLFLSC
jgi:hypothetical protein